MFASWTYFKSIIFDTSQSKILFTRHGGHRHFDILLSHIGKEYEIAGKWTPSLNPSLTLRNSYTCLWEVLNKLVSRVKFPEHFAITVDHSCMQTCDIEGGKTTGIYLSKRGNLLKETKAFCEGDCLVFLRQSFDSIKGKHCQQIMSTDVV